MRSATLSSELSGMLRIKCGLDTHLIAISLLKPNLELMSYQTLIDEGLNKIPRNLDAKLVKLVFKEYEAYNIISNVM